MSEATYVGGLRAVVVVLAVAATPLGAGCTTGSAAPSSGGTAPCEGADCEDGGATDGGAGAWPGCGAPAAALGCAEGGACCSLDAALSLGEGTVQSAAADGAGNVFVVIASEVDAQPRARVVRVDAASGVAGAAEDLGSASGAVVATDTAGRALVVWANQGALSWRRFDPTTGSWTPARPLPPGADAAPSWIGSLTMSPGGAALLVAPGPSFLALGPDGQYAVQLDRGEDAWSAPVRIAQWVLEGRPVLLDSGDAVVAVAEATPTTKPNGLVDPLVPPDVAGYTARRYSAASGTWSSATTLHGGPTTLLTDSAGHLGEMYVSGDETVWRWSDATTGTWSDPVAAPLPGSWTYARTTTGGAVVRLRDLMGTTVFDGDTRTFSCPAVVPLPSSPDFGLGAGGAMVATAVTSGSIAAAIWQPQAGRWSAALTVRGTDAPPTAHDGLQVVPLAAPGAAYVAWSETPVAGGARAWLSAARCDPAR